MNLHIMGRDWWSQAAGLRKLAFLLAGIAALVLAGGLLSACGGGASEEDHVEEPAAIQEALALLAGPDLSDLTQAQADLVQSALRQALGRAGTVRTTSGIDQQDLVFWPDGRVAMMRTFGTATREPPEVATPEVSSSETIRVYSGPPARFCDGREDADLVMVQEYVLEFAKWRVSTEAIPLAQTPLGMLLSSTDLSVAQDAGFSEEGGRKLRGFSVPFAQPGTPEATLTVWVDLEDGLIRRMETTLPGTPGGSFRVTFDYQEPIDIEVPSEPAAPDCVNAQ